MCHYYDIIMIIIIMPNKTKANVHGQSYVTTLFIIRLIIIYETESRVLSAVVY